MIDAATLERVRAVRLYHWREVCKITRSIDAGVLPLHNLEYWRRQHAMHMGFVQTLNALFPLGDTAERDAS